MMSKFLVVGVIAVSMLSCSPRTAVSQQDFNDCAQSKDIDISISACGRIVGDTSQSAGDRAQAYRWLGHGRMAKGNADAAIESFSSSIALDPSNLSAYVVRAVAYWSKGNRSGAIADYHKAVTLGPAKVLAMVAASPDLKVIADASAQDFAEASNKPVSQPVTPTPSVDTPVRNSSPVEKPQQQASVSPAEVAGSKRTFWAHNGSTLYLQASGAVRELYYDEPKPQLARAGVTPGTLLFRGTYASGNYSGDAFTFSKTCGAASFHVSGPVSNDFASVTVQGDQPVRDQASCAVTKTTTVTLQFDLCVKSPPDGSAALQCPIVD
jgi:hypothetical protein